MNYYRQNVKNVNLLYSEGTFPFFEETLKFISDLIVVQCWLLKLDVLDLLICLELHAFRNKSDKQTNLQKVLFSHSSYCCVHLVQHRRFSLTNKYITIRQFAELSGITEALRYSKNIFTKPTYGKTEKLSWILLYNFYT